MSSLTPTGNLLPPLPEEKKEELRRSMKEYGYLPGYPITLDQDGNVIDGHHRMEIAHELGIEPVTITVHCDNDWDRAIKAVEPNVIRRELDHVDRAFVYHKLRGIYERVFKVEAKERQTEAGKTHGRGMDSSATDVAQLSLANRARAGGHRTAKDEAAANEAADWSEVGSKGATQFNPPANDLTIERHRKAEAKRASDRLGYVLNQSGRTAERYLDRVEAFEEAAEKAGRRDLVAAFDAGQMRIDAAERALGLVSRGAGRLVSLDDAADAIQREKFVAFANSVQGVAKDLDVEGAKLLRGVCDPEYLFIALTKITRLLTEAKSKEAKQ